MGEDVFEDKVLQAKYGFKYQINFKIWKTKLSTSLQISNIL